MLHSELATKIYRKLSVAPRAFFESAEGRALVEKSVALVRDREGDREARALENLLTVSEAVSHFE